MTNEQTDKDINDRASLFRLVAVAYMNEGVSPGTLVASLMRIIWDLMKAQDMSATQASNELLKIVDGLREIGYAKKILN